MSMKIKFLILPNDKTKHLDKINMFKESSLIQTVEQNDLLYYFYWQINTHLYEDNCQKTKKDEKNINVYYRHGTDFDGLRICWYSWP